MRNLLLFVTTQAHAGPAVPQAVQSVINDDGHRRLWLAKRNLVEMICNVFPLSLMHDIRSIKNRLLLPKELCGRVQDCKV